MAIYPTSGENEFEAPGRLTMAWFLVWLPLVSQLAFPVSLLGMAGLRLHATKARSLASPHSSATYVLAIGIAGLWLVVPGWLPFGYGVWSYGPSLSVTLAVSTAATTAESFCGLAVTVLIGGLAMLLIGIVGLALAGRRPPGDPVDLTFPLGSGTIPRGERRQPGADQRASGHARGGAIRTLPRAELWRGSRAHQPRRPPRPRASSVHPQWYFIYGDPVAPCRGRVLFAEDGAADMPPPQADRAHMAGITPFSNADRCGLSWGTCNGAVSPCT